jgi:hypothetical protein
MLAAEEEGQMEFAQPILEEQAVAAQAVVAELDHREQQIQVVAAVEEHILQQIMAEVRADQE